MTQPVASQPNVSSGGAGEVFTAFAKLGVSAFGGPIAHLGYFREEFVVRRRWLDERAYADLVALCQFLPGPASSQVGFAIGLKRAGLLGALAAWVAFTLPSAILLIAFALGARGLEGRLALGLIHGLKLVSVAVVAQAVVSMARSLTPDITRAVIALAAIALMVFANAMLGQITAIMFGAVAGYFLCRANAPILSVTQPVRISRRVGVLALSVYLVLLIGAPLAAAITSNRAIAEFAAFYRSGALVFGGGHVVLPLLQHAVVGPRWVNQDAFLAGYGAAQAVPGPLFTFAAYLGASMNQPPNGIWGACLGLVAIFLPGLLALTAALPFWDQLRARDWAQAAMRGANAAVVGVLAAALYNPVWTNAVQSVADIVGAFIGFFLLTFLRAPPLVIVLLGACCGMMQAQWS